MKLILRTILFLAVLTLSLHIGLYSPRAHAVSGSDWRAGQIIDDGIFYNGNDMSVEQVQAYLDAKVPTCDTWGTQTSEFGGGTRAQYGTSRGIPPPYICLKNYYENPTTHASNLGTGNVPDGSLSAAQIIVQAAQAYSISVRALLVTLQKESAGPLLTDTWPFPSQYTNAMGYGCPDTAACDARYAGFYNQVTNAAWQFRTYKNNPSNYRYKPFQYNSILYNPDASCGSSTVYVSTAATAGLYNYTPYQPNAGTLSAGFGTAPCGAYGNRNFWLYFNSWFGSTYLPYAFKSPSSATVYLYVNGYRFTVPYMGMLQDYGISPDSIQTIDQGTVDAIPSGDATANISSSLSSLIKSPSDSDNDGGSIYFISAGKRYQVTSMNQFADFGFNTSQISYMPLSYIMSLPNGGMLSNFVSSPYGSVFHVTNGSKQLLLDYKTYITLNPSDTLSRFSYFGVDTIPSANPVSSQPFLVKFTDTSAVYLFNNGSFYLLPTFDAYTCWGFNSNKSAVASYQLPQSSYLAPIVNKQDLGCTVTANGNMYLMGSGVKYTIPASYGIAPSVNEVADISQIAATIPTAAQPLQPYIKGLGPTVWFISNGKLRTVPTYQDYVRLGANSALTVVDQSSLTGLVFSGIKLAPGSLVKLADGSTVYSINGDSRIAYNTSGIFLGHGNSWAQINSYSQADLDTLYPINTTTSMGYYLYDSASQTAYLADSVGCFSIPANMFTAYGLTQTSLGSDPASSLTSSSNFQKQYCSSAAVYIKATGQSLVYKLTNGSRQPINSYAKLQSDSGQSNPRVLTVSSDAVNTFPIGQPL